MIISTVNHYLLLEKLLSADKEVGIQKLTEPCSNLCFTWKNFGFLHGPFCRVESVGCDLVPKLINIT